MPQRRILRSDGALYVVLLVAVIGIIVCGNAVSEYYDLPRMYVQLTLYAILLALGYLVYRFCLVSFRYTLTGRMLTVSRVVGKKEKSEVSVHLRDITGIHAYADGVEKPRALYTGRRQGSTAATVSDPSGRYTLLISPSDGFKEKLVAQWKTERK